MFPTTDGGQTSLNTGTSGLSNSTFTDDLLTGDGREDPYLASGGAGSATITTTGTSGGYGK